MAGHAGLYVIVAVWIVVLLCLFHAVRGRRQLLFWTFLLFAITLTLQNQLVFTVVNPMLGGNNMTYQIYHVTGLIVCGLLDAVIVKGIDPRRYTLLRKALVTLSIAVAIGIQTYLFIAGGWGARENIQEGYFGTWEFFVYGSLTWLGLLFVAVSGGRACLRDLRTQRNRVVRVALLSVSCGCFTVFVYVGTTFTNAFLSAADPAFLVRNPWTVAVFPVVGFIATLLIAGGLGLPLVLSTCRRLGRFVIDACYLWAITPLWKRLLVATPQVSVGQTLARKRVLLNPGVRLYRCYVEVQDSLLIAPERSLSTAEERLIQRIERHMTAVFSPTGLRDSMASHRVAATEITRATVSGGGR